MLVEGIDDSVLLVLTFVFLLIAVVMCSYIRNNFLSVQQLNPRIHQESVSQVNQFRNELMSRTTGGVSEASEQEQAQRSRQHTNINCPICLTNSTLPIETNCGHIFCAKCIIQYWSHLTSNIYGTNMKCPMCRQSVTCLLPLYSRAEQQASSSEYRELFTQINNYNRRFSGAPRSYWDYITDIPILLRHALNELFSFDGLSIWYRIRFGFMILVALCYFVSPLDIIPEALFGLFGLIDDILVVLFLAVYMCTLYRQIIANRR